MAYFRCDVPHVFLDDKTGESRWLHPGEVFEADAGAMKAKVDNGYLFSVNEAAFLAWKAKNIPPAPRVPEPVLPPKLEGLSNAGNTGNARIQNQIPKAGHDSAEREDGSESNGRNARIVANDESEQGENDERQDSSGKEPEEDEEKPSRQIPKPRVIKGR